MVIHFPRPKVLPFVNFPFVARRSELTANVSAILCSLDIVFGEVDR